MNPILGAFLILAFASCSGSSPLEPVPPRSATPEETPDTNEDSAGEVELRLDAPTEYQGLNIRWSELEDSRCPTGTTCIWAGQLVVTLEVWREGGDPERVELLRRIGSDPLAATAQGYDLRLLGVEPHPKEGVTIERGDYVATIEILNAG